MSKSTIYLTLDRRSHRIRITNEMLAYIGMPKYLQFLINPVEKVMLVRAIEQGAAKEQAYKVKHQPSNESYIEIHSKLLIDKFGDAFTEYENGKGVYVNHTNKDYKLGKTLVPAMDYLIKE